jgi:hypothetical protein|tara:strand:- start:36 stop:845 length:810 start_codon:yes stop_codon:yes gene_type:complete
MLDFARQSSRLSLYNHDSVDDLGRHGSEPRSTQRRGQHSGRTSQEKNRKPKLLKKNSNSFSSLDTTRKIKKKQHHHQTRKPKQAAAIETVTRQYILPIEQIRQARHLLQEMSVEPGEWDQDKKTSSISPQLSIPPSPPQNSDSFCFLPGVWDQDKKTSSIPPLSIPPSPPQLQPVMKQKQPQEEQARDALSKFVDVLFSKSSTSYETNKAAKQWCIYRGIKESQGAVVVSVARHIKNAASSKQSRLEQNEEIKTRLEGCFEAHSVDVRC